MAYSQAHTAISIAIFHHRGCLHSYESDERRRIQQAYDIIGHCDDELDPFYSELWQLTRGEDTPTAAARAKCHRGTLAPLQCALAKLLRLVPAYVALPLRTVPVTAAAADETFECFRDEVDIRMRDKRMRFATTREKAEGYNPMSYNPNSSPVNAHVE